MLHCRGAQINIWGIYDALRSASLAPRPPDGDAPPHACVAIAPMLPRPHGAAVGKRPSGIFEDAWGYPLPPNSK